MNRTLVRGGVVALIAAVVAFAGPMIGITTVWPALLAAAVGLAAVTTIGRAGAFVAGATVSWFTLAIRAGFLPDMAASRALAVIAAIALLTGLAVATRDRLPLWAGLAGYAAFAGLYEPQFAAAPTSFLVESPIALLVVLASAGIGFVIATATHFAGPHAVASANEGGVL